MAGLGQCSLISSPAVPPPAASTDAPPSPMLHPLAALAEQLEALPVTRLRPLAGVTSKRHRKADLIAMVAAMPY